ncbi:MAG: hypothetical protein JXQ27_03970 [Acidobacteria bacterium]|nr:hypothetical protein [Acidobacteriota bacterium]
MKAAPSAFVMLMLVLTGVMWLKAGEVRHEYGGPAEMKGAKAVFIDTGSQLTVRTAIADTIRKELPGLTIAERIDEAEIVLDFTLEIDRRTAAGGIVIFGGIGTPGSHGGVDIYQPAETTWEYGRGLVYRPLGKDVIRILMEFRGQKSTILQRSPARQFARKFVDEFQKANR